MLKVIFCHDGHHVSDAHVLEYVDSVFYEYDFGGRIDMEVKVGNELIVDGFVLRVLEKKFPANEIEIYDNDVKMRIDECRGLVYDDTRKITMGERMRMTKAIIDIGFSNIKRKKMEGDAIS